MANQPGYQDPGQNNAAGQGGGNTYQQNQLSGAGYQPVINPDGGITPGQSFDNAGYFGTLGTYSNPSLQARQQQIQNRDYVGGIQQALQGQLQGLKRERSGAQQQLMNQQMGMGFGGLTGMDVAGLGQQFAESAAGMQRQANLDIRDAEQMQQDALFALEQEMGADAEMTMQSNVDAVTQKLNELTLNAEMYTGPDGATVMLNPNLLQELTNLQGMAATRPVSKTEFAMIINGIVARYGKMAYVAPSGVAMGTPGFGLASQAPIPGQTTLT